MSTPGYRYWRMQGDGAGNWWRHPEAAPESVRCTGPQDTSPAQTQAGYESRCTLCWLGYPHTQDLHLHKGGTKAA